MLRCGKIVVAVAVLALATSPSGATDRPIIGVLTQELPYLTSGLGVNATSYIPAGYIKAVEAAGARAVPVFINRTQEYYQYVMKSVNGLLFPGGDVDFNAPHGYGAAGRLLIDLATKLQDSGVSFPILGVCQGFELIMFVASKAKYSMEFFVPCNVTNSALPLKFRQGFMESSLYKMATPEVLDILKTLPVTSNHHRLCITDEKLKEFHLDTSWRMLTANQDPGGVTFVSSSEHFSRPIVGVQFHPEKNMYEWNPKQANPHFRKAILSARLFYDWLVAGSRANDQRFPDQEQEARALIYNYNPKYTGAGGGYDEQVYFFYN